jgi:hypothetical protein
METAIIERCVTVNLTKQYQTKHRAAAFNRLHSNPTVLSALGKQLLEVGFSMNLEGLEAEMRAIQLEIEERLPSFDDENVRRAAPRLIFNKAVVVHGLRILRHVLQTKYGSEFNPAVDTLISSIMLPSATVQGGTVDIHAMSEVSKVMNRLAVQSRDLGTMHELARNKDYLCESDWMELRVERAYDQYRRYCAGIHDTPLFDSVEAFIYALNSYSPVIDRTCIDSVLRDDGSTERVVRLSQKALAKEGVQSFR